MTKCFQCIKDEHHERIKWSQVLDAVVIVNGTGYCYNHLQREINWKENEEKEE